MSRWRAGRCLGWCYCIAVIAFLLLPVLIMVPASFGASESLEFPPHELSLRWYKEVLGDRQWLGSAALSGRLALFGAFIATSIGILIALVHIRLGAVKPNLRAFLMLPVVAPHIVLATGMFSLLLNAHLLGNQWILGLLHASLAVPLTMIVVVNAADSIDPLLWTAASTLGARSWTIVRTIILPAIGVSAVVAFVLAFVISWDEVTFAVFVGPTATPTLPSRMFSYLKELINPSLTAIATLLLGITLLAGGLVALLKRLRPTRAVIAVGED